MRNLIVAHYNEPLVWLPLVAKSENPWAIHVVSNGVHRPNTGREAGAYIWWITQNYWWLNGKDTYAFVQGDPYPHCPEIVDELNKDVDRYVEFSDWVAHTDAVGGPHHGPALPVAEWYTELVGKPFPEDGIEFGAGAQWMTTGSNLLRHSYPFWQRLAVRADWESGTPTVGGAWVLERLWGAILG